MDAIFTRVSVRSFSDERVSEEDIEKMLRAGMQAPTAANKQPWQFVVVDDPQLLEQLGKTSPYSGAAAKAPLAIVPTINETGSQMLQYSTLDLSACTENILLEAAALGLGGVWLCVYPEQDYIEHVRKTLGMPDTVTPFSLLAIGHPKDEVPAQRSRYDTARIHRNKW